MSTVPTGLAGRGRRGWALGAAGAPLAPAGGWGPGAAPLAAAGRWSNEEAWEAWEACHRPDSEGSQGETGSEAGAHSPRPAVDSICLGGRSPTPPHCLTPLSALSRILGVVWATADAPAALCARLLCSLDPLAVLSGHRRPERNRQCQPLLCDDLFHRLYEVDSVLMLILWVRKL